MLNRTVHHSCRAHNRNGAQGIVPWTRSHVEGETVVSWEIDVEGWEEVGGGGKEELGGDTQIRPL